METNKAFNPFDYVSGNKFRALLNPDYLSLVRELYENVSSDRLIFALEVGSFFYRAVYPERQIMVAMVAASGLNVSELLTAEENSKVQIVQALLDGSFNTSDKRPALTEEVKALAGGVALQYLDSMINYCRQMRRESLGWDYHVVHSFFKKWYAFSDVINPSKYSWELYEAIEKLAQQEQYDTPCRDFNRDIYDIEAPSEAAADEIVQIARCAGFYFGVKEPWTGLLKVPKHFRLKSFPWQKYKLLRLVQLVGIHYPDAKIQIISPITEAMPDYYWYRDELHVSEKFRIFSRMNVDKLLKKTHFSDPWEDLKYYTFRKYLKS